MNPVEWLNGFAGRAVQVMSPIFLQSSLLIVFLLVLDWAGRRRVRPAVRYAFWLLVLVKLVLPPSLALPTGMGWWLRSPPARQLGPATVITADAPVTVRPQVLSRPALAPPAQPGLNSVAMLLLTSSALTVGLLGAICVRSLQVTRIAKRAGPAPAWLEGLADEARRLVGLRGRVRLGLVDHPVCPAICGLRRPIILLPHALVERMAPEKLQSVLVHELIHLRRGDIWVNCLQALLQCVYWWHPLVWVANARLRRTREEAVDDGVVHALRERAEAYAPALLDVARLALHKPLASLGLVGIFESRGALRNRVERLLVLPTPRRAGLTLTPLIFVMAFAAVALPMGQRRIARGAQTPAGTTPTELVAADGNPAGADEPASPLLAPQRALIRNAASRPADPPQPPATHRSTHSPQLNFRVKFIEIPERDATNFWTKLGWPEAPGSDGTRILKPKQMEAALSAVRADPNNSIRNEGSVTTLPGRQCDIEWPQMRTIVTNLQINPAALKPPGVTGGSNSTAVNYRTAQMEFGPRLELVANVATNSTRIHLTAIPTLKEFLGYDKPTNSITWYANGRKMQAVPPLPRFHVSSVTNAVTVNDGDTVVLGELTSLSILKWIDKVPVLGDLPLLGRLFRKEGTSTEKKKVLVLVTPTLIDAAGNRLHPEDR